MRVSNPNKEIFPATGFTKADLVEHYRRVAPVMLPHLRDRPLTLERYPNGVERPGFFQKNASPHFPARIGRVAVPKEDGQVTYPLVRDEDGLLYLANQGTVTFHIWNGRLPQLERPDRLVIDLDPERDRFDDARAAAREARRVLGEVGLPSGLMTTGSNGYHVVTPLSARVGLERVERMARQIAELVVLANPKRFTTEFLREQRRERVFIDWLRNRWAQTTVCPWSLRPRPSAPVAVPIGWDELGETDPGRWTLETVQERLDRPDPWPQPADPEGAIAALDRLAEHHGVEAETPFDRFGRKR